MSNLARLSLILLAVVLVRLAMEWRTEAWLVILLPVAFFGLRDLRRWRQGSRAFSLTRTLLRKLHRSRLALGYMLRGGLVRRERAQPGGYCPRCGYPINPGRCPECGIEATAETIRKSPPGRIRRHRGKIALAVISLAIAWGAHHAYQNVNWTARRSTQSLFGLMSLGNSLAVEELESRFRRGVLNTAEKKKLWDTSLKSRLKVVSPYPAESHSPFLLIAESSLPGLSMEYEYFLKEFEILVDGELNYRSNDGKIRSSMRRYRGEWFLTSHPIKPGIHDVTIRGDIVISGGDLGSDTVDLLAVHRCRMGAGGTVEIIDRPAIEFLKPLGDSPLRKSIREGLLISTTLAPNWEPGAQFREVISCVQVHMNSFGRVSGFLEAKPSGTDDSAYRVLRRTSLRANNNFWYPIDNGLEVEEMIDVRFRPDPNIAAQYLLFGTEPYFDETIEVKELVVRKPQDYGSFLRRNRPKPPSPPISSPAKP